MGAVLPGPAGHGTAADPPPLGGPAAVGRQLGDLAPADHLGPGSDRQGGRARRHAVRDQPTAGGRGRGRCPRAVDERHVRCSGGFVGGSPLRRRPPGRHPPGRARGSDPAPDGGQLPPRPRHLRSLRPAGAQQAVRRDPPGPFGGHRRRCQQRPRWVERRRGARAVQPVQQRRRPEDRGRAGTTVRWYPG